MNLLKYEKPFPGRYGFDRNSFFTTKATKEHEFTLISRKEIYPKFPWAEIGSGYTSLSFLGRINIS